MVKHQLVDTSIMYWLSWKVDGISSTYIILEKGGGGGEHLRTFYADFVSFHHEDFQRFPIFIINSDYTIALGNQKRMLQGNTKGRLDYWSVNCNKHLNKRYHIVKKKVFNFQPIRRLNDHLE